MWLSRHWSLACLICKDLGQEPGPRALVELRVNLALVPTLSFKMDAFRAAASDIATWGQGISVIANAVLPQRPRGARPPAIVGLPSQYGSVVSEAPPARSLWAITIGNQKKKPTFVTIPTDVPGEAEDR